MGRHLRGPPPHPQSSPLKLTPHPPSLAQVRQWPGNVADLDFRPVVKEAKAFLLAARHVQEVEDMENSDAVAGKVPEAAFFLCAFFRIWCAPPECRKMCAVSSRISMPTFRSAKACFSTLL